MTRTADGRARLRTAGIVMVIVGILLLVASSQFDRASVISVSVLMGGLLLIGAGLGMFVRVTKERRQP